MEYLDIKNKLLALSDIPDTLLRKYIAELISEMDKIGTVGEQRTGHDVIKTADYYTDVFVNLTAEYAAIPEELISKKIDKCGEILATLELIINYLYVSWQKYSVRINPGTTSYKSVALLKDRLDHFKETRQTWLEITRSVRALCQKQKEQITYKMYKKDTLEKS